MTISASGQIPCQYWKDGQLVAEGTVSVSVTGALAEVPAEPTAAQPAPAEQATPEQTGGPAAA